jgi:hypothetical protein
LPSQVLDGGGFDVWPRLGLGCVSTIV